MEKGERNLRFMPRDGCSNNTFVVMVVASVVLAFLLLVVCLLCVKFDVNAPLGTNVLTYLVGIFLVIILCALHVLKFIYKSELAEKQKDNELNRKITWEYSIRMLSLYKAEREDE